MIQEMEVEQRVETCVQPIEIQDEQWMWLSAAMNNEAKILHTRTTSENLKKLYTDGLAVVVLSEGALIGFVAAWPVENGFIEVGSTWVREDMRGRRISVSLYEALKKLPGLRGKVVFGITGDVRAYRAGLHANLTLHNDWRDPIPWRLSCGPCDVVAEANKSLCSKRNAGCWLRLMDH